MRFLLTLLALTLIARAAGPHPSFPPAGSFDGLGVNIHFTDPKPGEVEMIAAAGFKWVRMDFMWAETERKRGEYDFSAYDRLMTALEAQKIRALFILDYGNSLYNAEPPRTDEARAAFAKWAAAAVKHFAGRGCVWEMWNEPNHTLFWKPRPDAAEYIALAKATAAALREAAPGEPFIGPGTSGIDFSFIEACAKAGLLEVWDAVSVHPYRQSAPETVAADYAQLRELITRYAPAGKTIPIISSEWGYSTLYPGLSAKDEATREAKQGSYLARSFLANVASGIPISIWYDWRDDGTNPNETEDHFGTVRHAYKSNATATTKTPGGSVPEVFEPKPAYLAMKALTGDSTRALAALGGFPVIHGESSATAKIRGTLPSPANFGNKLEADGDGKVASAQDIAIATPPKPLPGIDLPAWRITYRFGKGWKFLQLIVREPFPNLPHDTTAPPRAFGLWVYGDGKGSQLRIRFTDSAGQTFQPDGPVIDWTGWRYITFPLLHTAEHPLNHWGGKKDDTIHYPIQWEAPLILDNITREPVEGVLYLAGPMVVW